MRVNPLIIVVGLIGLFAVSMLIGYVGGQAFLAPARSGTRAPRVAVPPPVVPGVPSQPAAPLGPSPAPVEPVAKATPAQPAPVAPRPSSTPQAKASPPAPAGQPAAVNYRVQAGAFLRRENAEARVAQLKQDGFEPYIVQSGGLYRVLVGAFSERENAVKLADQVKARGYDVLIIPVR